jgi:formyltetrahydrofolate-dependent phosphoribosylglycinamide formyltransferase
VSAPPRIAVLVSGGGRSLENLAQLAALGELDARIALVLSNTPQAFALERAKRLGLAHAVVEPRAHADAASFSAAVFEEIERAGVELVVLAGFLRLLVVPERWLGRVLNIHPALLPKFGGKGFYGERVHRAVLEAGERVSGCTVHYVTNEYDRGPILLQRRTPVREGDDAHSLAERVFEEEKIALPEAIRAHFAARSASGL